jgi:hypothetical protein
MRKCHALLVLAVSVSLFSAASIGFAANCVTEPKPSGPGQHWYYQVDPVSHRKCWFAAQSGVQVHHAPPQSQSPSKLNRDTLTKTASGLKNGEDSNQLTSSSEQANRDVLFREFVLWDAFQWNGELEGDSK